MNKKIIIPFGIILVILTALIIYLFNSPDLLVNFFKSYERGTLTEKSIDIKKHKIIYLESGKGETVLLIHGFGGDKDNWTRFARKLIDKYHVIVIDLPGFGDSSKHDDLNYNIPNQVERLGEFVNKLNLKKFHLVGNSMGGAISSYYTYKYPESVTSLGLFDSAGVKSNVESHFTKKFKKGKNPLLVDSVEDYDRLLHYVFYNPPYIPGVLKNYFAVKAYKNRDFNNKVMEDIKRDPFSLDNYLSQIKVPVFILWGDTDRVIDISSVKVFEKNLENSTTVIMEKCGHLPMLERPGEAVGHYLNFLTNIKK